MTMIIGITGENRSGKSTVKKILKNSIKNLGTSSVKTFEFRDYFEKILKILSMEDSRANLQKVSIALRESFGEDVISNALIKDIRKKNPDIAIICGLRWQQDLLVLRSFSCSYLIHVTATTEIRWERDNYIREKTGLPPRDLEEFMREGKSKADIGVVNISKAADYVIENNTNEDNLRARIENIFEDIITPPF